MGWVHAGHRARAMGHNGMEQGHHAEMGCVQVATGPTKHRIEMVRKHGGPGGRSLTWPLARRWFCAKGEAIPAVADHNPSNMILTINCLKLVYEKTDTIYLATPHPTLPAESRGEYP